MKHAFSLVELSIVLVILGLLTGGILTGQSLIRAAELRSITTEFQNYQTATMTFRNKYFALPGDMSNAEAFWQTMATGTCPNATAGVGTQTCNGNGDGLIEESGAASQTNETFTFWQHLANAGLIEGTYSGLAGSSDSDDGEIGNNVPASRLGNAGWAIWSWGNAASGGRFSGTYNNVLVFGNEGAGITEVAAITPEEAWNIDTKVDDALPATGLVRVRFRVDCALAANGSALTTSGADAAQLDAVYNLTDQGTHCSLIFDTGF